MTSTARGPSQLPSFGAQLARPAILVVAAISTLTSTCRSPNPRTHFSPRPLPRSEVRVHGLLAADSAAPRAARSRKRWAPRPMTRSKSTDRTLLSWIGESEVNPVPLPARLARRRRDVVSHLSPAGPPHGHVLRRLGRRRERTSDRSRARGLPRVGGIGRAAARSHRGPLRAEHGRRVVCLRRRVSRGSGSHGVSPLQRLP